MRMAVCLVLVASLLPVGALAAPNTREFSRLVKEAERLYGAGKYQDSAERLIEAYAYQPHPRLIYNIARAYDQAGELALALEYYQRYLNSTQGTDPTLLKRSALSIDRIRELMRHRERQAEQQARLTEEARRAQEREAEQREMARKAEEALRAREEAANRRRASTSSLNRILAFGLGGVAVAGLGTGTVFGIQANTSKSNFGRAETLAEKQRLQGQTQSQALIADIGFGASIVSAVAAVLLYPKGSATETEAGPRATLVPTGRGAGLEVNF